MSPIAEYKNCEIIRYYTEEYRPHSPTIKFIRRVSDTHMELYEKETENSIVFKQMEKLHIIDRVTGFYVINLIVTFSRKEYDLLCKYLCKTICDRRLGFYKNEVMAIDCPNDRSYFRGEYFLYYFKFKFENFLHMNENFKNIVFTLLLCLRRTRNIGYEEFDILKMIINFLLDFDPNGKITYSNYYT